MDKGKTYKVVTNSYVAGGRDGYVTFKNVAEEGRLLDTYLDYAQSFVDYVQNKGTVKKLDTSEYSTQSFKKVNMCPYCTNLPTASPPNM